MDFAAFLKIAARFVEPGNLLTVLLAAGVVLQLFRIGFGLWIVSAAATFLCLVLLLPVDQWLARPLENRFPRPPEPAHIDGILVLSSGQQRAISATRGIPVQHFAEGDMVAAAELMRRHPEARLVFSGGSAFGTGAAVDVARKIFDQLGIDQGRIAYEGSSRDTWENLLFSQKLAQPKPAEAWLLVASALHMPRAMGVAQRLDWRIAPWPTDFLTPGGDGPVTSRHSLGRNLSTVDAAAHEWLGLLVYRVAGKTDALFPVP